MPEQRLWSATHSSLGGIPRETFVAPALMHYPTFDGRQIPAFLYLPSEYGSLENDRAFLESISPINHVEDISAPLFVIHGANDPRVPVGEAEQIVAALRSRNVPVEYLSFEDEGHSLVKRSNKLVAYPAVAGFLARYLDDGH